MRYLLLAVTALLGIQVRRWRRALTMEPDHAAYWRRRRRSPGPHLLVTLGDSLAQGLGALHPQDSWAGRLADTLEARHGVAVRVVNLSVNGATVADVLAAQLPAMPAGADTVAVAIGTNDAVQTDPELFAERLRTLCAALPAGALVADVPDLQWGAARVAGARCSALARDVVAGFPALHPVALEAATGRLWPWELGPDLAHPSGLGYRRYGRAFAAALT